MVENKLKTNSDTHEKATHFMLICSTSKVRHSLLLRKLLVRLLGITCHS